MSRFAGARERRYIELEHVVVQVGGPQPITSRRVFPKVPYDRTIKALRLDAIIADVDGAAPVGGYARAFANLLAGTRASIIVNDKPIVGPLTFVRGLFKTQNAEDDEPIDTYNAEGKLTMRYHRGQVYTYDAEGRITSKRAATSNEADEFFVNGRHRDIPNMHHAINGPMPKDVFTGPSTDLGIEVTYDGPPAPSVPLSFMRVVLLGIDTQEVQ